MAHTLDPYQLVALMSASNTLNDHNTPRCDVSDNDDVVNRIIDRYKTNRFTFRALDALAEICISKPGVKQIVALAVQLNSREEKIRLTISESEGDNRIPNYLKSVWARLAQLSEKRKAGSSPTHDHVGGEPQITSPPALKRAIFREVYQFTMVKMRKRLKKWVASLNRFVDKLRKRRGIGVDLKGLEKDIRDCFIVAEAAIDCFTTYKVPEGPCRDYEWDFAYELMEVFVGVAQSVLADDVGCESLVKELQDSDSDAPFPLRRALEKLSSLHKSFQTLVSYALIDRRGWIFRYELSIVVVPVQPLQVVQLPSSCGEWESVIKVLGASRARQPVEGHKLVQKFSNREYHCPIHCECELVAYLHSLKVRGTGAGKSDGTDEWDIPPFDYIGLSGFSCGACSCWIKSYNQLGGRRFTVRGGQEMEKWDWPWGLPNIMSESLVTHMTENLALQYHGGDERALRQMRLRAVHGDIESPPPERQFWLRLESRVEEIHRIIAARRRPISSTEVLR